jgi:hypothetical protein
MGAFGGDAIQGNVNTDNHGTVTTKKNLSQEGFNKIVYDILSSDSGLAGLASGENASGGFGSSAKTLLAQDLVTKLAGELANVTAETTQSTDMHSDKSTPLNRFFGEPQSISKATVICTELVRQGRFPVSLYEHPKAKEHFANLHPLTIKGYHFWAVPAVPVLAHSWRWSNIAFFIANARYQYICYGRKSLTGFLSIYVAQPVCFIIGCVAALMEKTHARFLGQSA